jgi:hypothetical protein
LATILAKVMPLVLGPKTVGSALLTSKEDILHQITNVVKSVIQSNGSKCCCCDREEIDGRNFDVSVIIMDGDATAMANFKQNLTHSVTNGVI